MPMKLYNANLSPFAARCRIQIYAKGLEVEMANMPDAIDADAFARLTPMHKVPTLDHDGDILPESEVISEYLEDLGGAPALRPDEPKARARVRLLSRIGDLYLLVPLGDLFGQIDPQTRDQELVDRLLDELCKGLTWLDFYLDGSAYAVGDRLTLADCALMPILFFVEEVSPMWGRKDLLDDVAKVAAYYEATQADPAVARVHQELSEALRRMQNG